MEAAAWLTLLFCFLAAPHCALACEIAVVNNTSTDLQITDDDGHAVTVGPNDKAWVMLPTDFWVEFGAEAFNYTVSPAQRSLLCPSTPTERAVLRANPDASLSLEGPREQPQGFPLRPSGKVDLTGSPSNTSVRSFPSTPAE